MIPAILALFVLALAWVGWLGAGVFLMWRGVRGRLVDRDPRCGRCDYILLGFLSRPSRCPECGSRLLRPGAVRLGRREPRRSLVMAAALMMLLGLSPAVVAVAPSGASLHSAPATQTLSFCSLVPFPVREFRTGVPCFARVAWHPTIGTTRLAQWKLH